ncbi:hypothetical protein GCM10007301_27050 [Azorhizobium oxalatiphilum]|uniref:Uncharacterized protein n=1 Tax=Azorhizobium oxalatiphilum TaxID=980631 RepID=A0A917C2P0_9HYPH|nr:hypothetical protein [Azorhizobium oxalatiphilum]GGF65945.1 hypothetical protein GCM10007301_27050 [Azorhizobium oxalatiphilum]
MPVPEWLDTLWDRVVNFRTDREIDRENQRLMRKYNFGILPISEELGAHAEVAGRVSALGDAGHIYEIEPLYEEARRADIVLPGAFLLHEMLLQRLMPANLQDRNSVAGKLAPFRAAWEGHPTPFTAALYALTLHEAAYAARGTDLPDTVSDQQWADMQRHLTMARQVLDATPDTTGTCQLWHRANYDLALEEGLDFNAYQARFEAAWALDRFNLQLCENHAIRVMPRWMGRDAHDVESFARRAMAMTETRYGAGAYAMIYHGQCEMGHHELEDSLCEPALAQQGFEDLIARYGGQSLYNRHAGFSDWVGDHATVNRLFSGPLRTIVPQIWSGADDDERVTDALDTFSLARDMLDLDEDEEVPRRAAG